MTDIPLFELNPRLDRMALAAEFAHSRRLQVRDFLTPQTARVVHAILSRETPWGLAWKAGEDGPHAVRRSRLATADMRGTSDKIARAMRGNDYAFAYGQYPILDAYLQKWAPDSPHDLLLEHINDAPFLDFMRAITGIASLKKADAQATLYAPGQFLALHNDSHVAEGWQIAYVMSFCAEEWRPDWGGYLNFFDEEGDIVAGYKPRFNALNLFAVPQAHNVSYVPAFAPVARYSITGWLRDR